MSRDFDVSAIFCDTAR